MQQDARTKFIEYPLRWQWVGGNCPDFWCDIPHFVEFIGVRVDTKRLCSLLPIWENCHV